MGPYYRQSPIPLHLHLLLLLVLLVLLSAHISLSSSSSATNADLFKTWCKQHGKIYTSEEEKLYRHGVFENNLANVIQHNSKENSSYTLALNAFADLTHHEFKASRLGLNFPHSDVVGSSPHRLSSLLGGSSVVGDVPASLDWRERGAVTPVKDQASCGACWSFSASGAIEGINKIVTGSLVSLSEQELVDCVKYYNSGCKGGLMDYAYDWVIKNGGIQIEQDYPYQAGDRTCNKNKLQRHVVTIDGYIDVPGGNEKELLQAVVSQPVSVGICGSDTSFQLYSKGIFTGPCSTSLDHAVLIVGYGSENGLDYWILKNSWGTSWGMNGYMHLLRNGPNRGGVCGVNMLASYPTKTSPNPPSSPNHSVVDSTCSIITKCEAGENCCCGRRILGLCIHWDCCPVNTTVCCKDHKSCCSQSHPICGDNDNLCYSAAQGNSTMSKWIKRRGSSAKFSLFKAWNM